ncbi:unnamed protein product [Phyllotreta striolata]|uniref:Uncharacterized protein n=1 Tax=Phyllotreta striolata TaxID=444603 RepID=A0A9N9XRX7_PHYSR|nr:unnamed protein product [Phyllotreta striolata]
MVLSNEDDVQLLNKLRDLCSKLNLDQKTIDLAWDNFSNINKNFTLEGDALSWLGCAVFIASQSVTALSNVDQIYIDYIVKKNGVSLTSLLCHSKLSFAQFFSNIKKWVDMAHLSEHFKNMIQTVEDTYGVSYNTFKKYCSIFPQIFVPPNLSDLENSKSHKNNRKSRPVLCNTSKVFEFIWNLFIIIKGEDEQCSTDLVKSYHLLFGCLDLAFKNAFLAKRRDLLNPSFQSLPRDWSNSNFEVPKEAPCIIDQFSMLVEAEYVKTYPLRDYITNLIKNKVLLADPSNFTGLFNEDNFDNNFKNVINAYETHLLNIADVDERIFLAEYRRLLLEQQNAQSIVVDSGCPVTSNFPHSMDKSITQNITNLHNLLNRKSSASSESFLNQANPLPIIQQVLDELTEKFVSAYVRIFPTKEQDAKNRSQIGVTLFYKFVQNILDNERKIGNDISVLLQKDLFYQCMLACCMEIVLFSYNFPNKFPWILEVFDLQPYHFVKVIELIVRTKNKPPSDIIIHLNKVEEMILESLMWRSDSIIWITIDNLGGDIPNVETSALPGCLFYVERTEMNTESHNGKVLQSPFPSALDRFQSPVRGQLLVNVEPCHLILNQSEDQSLQPRKRNSLSIILSKFYYLAYKRMDQFCTKLNLKNIEVKQKIWTFFEKSIQSKELIKDRHLDQLLMCAIYVICKISDFALMFQDILKHYREQSQCSSDIYRKVFVENQIKDGMVIVKTDNLITFYNTVYVKVMEKFAKTFTQKQLPEVDLLLSPLPAVKRDMIQKFANVYVRPLESHSPISDSSIKYTFSRSPSKDLQDINRLVNSNKVMGKRLLVDDQGDQQPNKKIAKKFKSLVDYREEFNQNTNTQDLMARH